MRIEAVRDLIKKLGTEGLEVTIPEHTIPALCQRSRDISLEKGWLNPDGTDPRPFHTVIGLFHTELSEAFEEIRNNKSLNSTWYESKGGGPPTNDEDRGKKYLLLPPEEQAKFKPCGIPVELADFVIRVCQYYGSANLGGKLERGMFEVVHETNGEMLIADDPELLITQLHADVSKAWVEERNGGDPTSYLAAALVTTVDFCRKKDINIWAAIDEKEAYNRTRSHKHGGKKV